MKMKKRKFVAITNAEYLERKGLCDFYERCPIHYGLESVKHDIECVFGRCADCWKLPAKYNGKWILKEVKEK